MIGLLFFVAVFIIWMLSTQLKDKEKDKTLQQEHHKRRIEDVKRFEFKKLIYTQYGPMLKVLLENQNLNKKGLEDALRKTFPHYHLKDPSHSIEIDFIKAGLLPYSGPVRLGESYSNIALNFPNFYYAFQGRFPESDFDTDSAGNLLEDSISKRYTKSNKTGKGDWTFKDITFGVRKGKCLKHLAKELELEVDDESAYEFVESITSYNARPNKREIKLYPIYSDTDLQEIIKACKYVEENY